MMEKQESIHIPYENISRAFVVFIIVCACGFADMVSASSNLTEKARFEPAVGTELFSYPETLAKSSFLPLTIPEADEAPYFLKVRLSEGTCLPDKLCFEGTAADDIRLNTLKVVVRTTDYGFEVYNTPVSGSQVDLSVYCIENIGQLLSFKKGEYEVVFTARDSFGHVSAQSIFFYLPSDDGCRQDMYGGQCVNYVRDFFGGRYDLMPGLCIYADCGAYHAWDAWDLGYGKGQLPAKNSILIMDKEPLLFGHVAVVTDRQKNADGTYTLTVNESNWDRDELIDCNVRYTYMPDSSSIIRQGTEKVYDVAGFIYGEAAHPQKDVPPEYENAALPDSVTYPDKAFFRGYAKDDVGLKEVKIEVSGPKGTKLPVIDRKVSGLRKDLSDLWFDSSNHEYAGVEGHYLVKLIVVDTMNQKQTRIFSVKVNNFN